MNGPTLGHPDRPVAFTEWNGRPAVEKRYLSDSVSSVSGGAGSAWAVMCALWASPFGAERQPPGLPEPIAGDQHWVIMERVDGVTVGQRRSLGTTVAVSTMAAQLIADLHASGVVVPRRRTGRRLVRALTRKRDELRDGPMKEIYAQTIELLDPAALDGDLVVSHGDFSPRNVLVSPSGLRLIDFDRCQMAPRARDVTYWGAWVWATQVLAAQPASWAIADAFEVAYTTACAHPPFDRRHRDSHRAAALLRIAHGWTALQTRPELAVRVVAEAHRQLAPSEPR